MNGGRLCGPLALVDLATWVISSKPVAILSLATFVLSGCTNEEPQFSFVQPMDELLQPRSASLSSTIGNRGARKSIHAR